MADVQEWSDRVASVEPDPTQLSTNDSTQFVPHSPAGAETCYCLIRPRGVGHAVPELSRECLARLIDFPEMLLRAGLQETVKYGRSTLLARSRLNVGGRMIEVAYKRVRRRSWWKMLTESFRTNRTLRCWRLGHEFLRRGIPTARPLAVIIPRQYRAERATFMAVEWLTGARNLHFYCMELARCDARARYLPERMGAAALGRLVGLMHAKNVSHRDLKAPNLLLRGDGREVESFVVDLDGATVRRRISRRIRLWNLARLNVSLFVHRHVGKAARLRFLRSYLRELGGDNARWKAEWREVARLSALRLTGRNESTGE